MMNDLDIETELQRLWEGEIPRIEEVEYTFTAASDAEPWVQHRATKPNGTSVLVQMSALVRGQVTMRVAQAVNGMP